MTLEIPKVLAPFECYGVDFSGQSGDNLIADCIFCGKAAHMYANPDTTQWDCKHCGKNGNTYTFLSHVAEHHRETTVKRDYMRLERNRLIPRKVLRRYKLAWDGLQWLLPAISDRGTILDIRRWSFKTKRVMSTKGCNSQLFGLQFWKKGTSRIWLCEGEWDLLALSDLFISLKKTDIVLAVPGADVFKKDWAHRFSGRNVVLCYDHDTAGRRGTKKAADMLRGKATKLDYIVWPEDAVPGYDIRAFISEKRSKGWSDRRIHNALVALIQCVPPSREGAGAGGNKAGNAGEEFFIAPANERPSFRRLLRHFRQHVCMDTDMVDGLRLVLAVVLSEQMSGSPLWVQIVGPPGSGKTLLIQCCAKSDRVLFRSTITAKMLVSGFQSQDDPSLLAHVNNMTVAIKDSTEMYAGAKWEANEADSVLRGAYDGSVNRSYGNAVQRSYQDLHFSMIMGVTNMIHGRCQSTLGERFVRFQMRPLEAEAIDRRMAMALSEVTDNPEDRLQDIVRLFLARNVDPADWPCIPDTMKARLMALAHMTALFRAQIERTNAIMGNLSYRPEPEYGTRLIKQLAKLAVSLAYVDGLKEVDNRIWLQVRRVAIDSMIGFHIDIALAVHSLGKSAVTSNVALLADIPLNTVTEKIGDMLVLGILREKKLDGKEQAKYTTDKAKAVRRFVLSRRVTRWLEIIGIEKGDRNAIVESHRTSGEYTG